MKKKILVPLTLFTAASFSMMADNRPNIIVILCDDMGYSDLGCMGSEIRTPHIDALAGDGLRFTQFYNCGRSCPTRASLLTGLYAHQAGVGDMMQDQRVSGYRGDLSTRSVTIAEVLKTAGYATYMSGKWHVTNVPYSEAMHQTSKHNWPRQRGFDRFYGTLHGACPYWDPSGLARDNVLISPFTDKEYQPEEGQPYYYTDAISDNAVRYIREHDRKQPFFMYVAYTAPHWPMQAPEEMIESYNGVYDAGYGPVREDRFKRMCEMGIVDGAWALSTQAGSWERMKHPQWEARLMQTYAAMITVMDQGVGRIVNELRRSGQLDNTLILFLQDNGGCAEGTGRSGRAEPKDKPVHGRDWCQTRGREVTRDGRTVRTGPQAMPGPDDTFIAYGQAWANVSNTPFREYKSFVHEGGISTPLIAYWPKKIRKPGIRRTPGHIIDIMATCVELSGADYPATYKGHDILPYEGRSLLPVFKKERKKERVLLFEHEGNAAIRVGRWKLVGKRMFAGNKIRREGWELYDMEKDCSETVNLAALYPEKVKELLKLFEQEAGRTFILPKP